MKRFIVCLTVIIAGFVSANAEPVKDAAASVKFALTTNNPDQTATCSPSDYFMVSYIELGEGMNFNQVKSVDGYNQCSFNPNTQENSPSDNNRIRFAFKTKSGITFTPQKVSFRCYRHGTGGGLLDVSYVHADGTKETLATGIKPTRNNELDKDTKYWEATLTSAKATQGESALVLNLYSLASAKQVSIGDLVVSGLINGEIIDVPIYNFSLTTNPAGAGVLACSPVGTKFESGTLLKISQTRNFGYKFLNWQDADSKEILSKDDTYKFEITSNRNIVANYATVPTYSLDITTTAGTPTYLVALSPSPTEVNSKKMYEEDTQVRLIADKRPILSFSGWSNGETSDTTYVLMNQNQSIKANYVLDDFIAGWDFYTANNGSRPADFAAEDNDADVLVMANPAGTVGTWLDKSGEGAQFGRMCAVCWRPLAEDWHFQTKVNAEAFTDIKVRSALGFSYNAYQKWFVQYSLNGTDWQTFGIIDMGKNRQVWADSTFSMPAAANNAKELYIRWQRDNTSEVSGTTATANDGISIAGIYITGTESYFDRGYPPVLLSTVPADGSTNASANGKVVLNFDEKVIVKEDSYALLDDKTQLPITVAGTSIMVEYKGFDYLSSHKISIPANVISDRGAKNFINTEIVVNFTVKGRPALVKKLYDFIVPDDGTFEEAIATASKRADTSIRYRIFVKKGSYKLEGDKGAQVTGSDSKTYRKPTTTINTPNLSIIGEGMNNTELYNYHENFAVIEGLGKAQAINLSSKCSETYVQDISFRNGCHWDTTNNGDGRCPALQDEGNKNIFKNFKLVGWQDSYLSNNQNGRFYFEDSELHGAVDYLCGKGNCIYNRCNLVIERNGVPLCAPSSRGAHGGYTFLDCTVHSANPNYYKSFSLGRPWGSGTPEAIYINLIVGSDVSLSAEGWGEMSGGYPYRFAEYNTKTEKGTVISLTQRKKTFADTHSNNPIISEEEVGNYTVEKIHGYDGWEPRNYTEQASAPKNVQVNSNTLTWDNNDYILCWAVLKDGAVIGFTKTPSFTIDGTGSYQVRAANEMGGLGEASETVNPSGIESPMISGEKWPDTSTGEQTYNLSGQQVADTNPGQVYIQSGKKYIAK